MKILVVEDNGLLAFMIEDVLTEAGYVVVGPAAASDDAGRLARTEAPDLALVDIDLERRGAGLDLARDLQDLGVPVIFATGQTARAREAAATALGALSKPFGPDAVVGTVEAARALLGGRTPGALPSELELFSDP